MEASPSPQRPWGGKQDCRSGKRCLESIVHRQGGISRSKGGRAENDGLYWAEVSQVYMARMMASCCVACKVQNSASAVGKDKLKARRWELLKEIMEKVSTKAVAPATYFSSRSYSVRGSVSSPVEGLFSRAHSRKSINCSQSLWIWTWGYLGLLDTVWV